MNPVDKGRFTVGYGGKLWASIVMDLLLMWFWESEVKEGSACGVNTDKSTKELCSIWCLFIKAKWMKTWICVCVCVSEGGIWCSPNSNGAAKNIHS